VDTGSPLRKCDHTKRKERSPILSKRDSLSLAVSGPSQVLPALPQSRRAGTIFEWPDGNRMAWVRRVHGEISSVRTRLGARAIFGTTALRRPLCLLRAPFALRPPHIRYCDDFSRRLRLGRAWCLYHRGRRRRRPDKRAGEGWQVCSPARPLPVAPGAARAHRGARRYPAGKGGPRSERPRGPLARAVMCAAGKAALSADNTRASRQGAAGRDRCQDRQAGRCAAVKS
jgi:hypothetical protein